MTRLEHSTTPIDQILSLVAEHGADAMGIAFASILESAMKIERDAVLGAAPFERTESRRGYANGYKPKTLDTRAGRLVVQVPKARDVEFYPSALEKGIRSERALRLAVAEMYVKGVSTRKVQAVLEQLCVGVEISSTQVSRAAAELDEELDKWRTRPLEQVAYLVLDARYEKVRHGGSVVDCAILSAIAVRVLVPATGQSRDLLTNASNARYTRGHIVFARDHTIHAVPFDLETLSVRGEPRPLGMSVIQSYAAPNSAFRTGAAQFAVSDAGDLAYAQGTIWPEFLTPLAWVTRDGEVEVIEADPGSYLAPRIDLAGRRILLSNFSEPASAIRMHDITRGVTSRVRRGVGGWVAWGPGPDDYTFSERSDGRDRVGWATIGDTAEPFMLDGPAGSVQLWLAEWSSDGRHLLCLARELDKPNDLFVWSKDDGWVNLSNTPDVWEIWPSFSPDGRWVSYISDSRVHVRPFLRAGPAIQVSTTKSSAPLWSPDGKELYYWSEEEEPAAVTGEGASGTTETQNWVMAAKVTYSDSGIDIGRPERLFSAEGYASVIPIRSWDMGPDGRFLMSISSSNESVRSAIDKFFPRRIRLIQNWAGTLGERAP